MDVRKACSKMIHPKHRPSSRRSGVSGRGSSPPRITSQRRVSSLHDSHMMGNTGRRAAVAVHSQRFATDVVLHRWPRDTHLRAHVVQSAFCTELEIQVELATFGLESAHISAAPRRAVHAHCGQILHQTPLALLAIRLARQQRQGQNGVDETGTVRLDGCCAASDHVDN
jgi:hypothetical protein